MSQEMASDNLQTSSSNKTIIHPSAIVDPQAKLGKGVQIGPLSVVGPHVEIGDHTQIRSHVVIAGRTQIGPHNTFFPFSCIGEAPQDLKYSDEPTQLRIGEHNVFREGCTVHRGTVQDNGVTVIGNHNLLMANTHVAHDCVLANHIILTNCAGIAGHVYIEDYAVCGVTAGVHQYCRIGQSSFLVHGAMITKDVVPYTMISGESARVEGLNLVGLKRRGFTAEQISAIKTAYKIIFRQGLTTSDAIAALKPIAADFPMVQPMIDSLINSKRGITR